MAPDPSAFITDRFTVALPDRKAILDPSGDQAGPAKSSKLNSGISAMGVAPEPSAFMIHISARLGLGPFVSLPSSGRKHCIAILVPSGDQRGVEHELGAPEKPARSVRGLEPEPSAFITQIFVFAKGTIIAFVPSKARCDV